MKRKLNKDEYNALLNAFSGDSFTFKKLSHQSRLFRATYLFVNVYALSTMLLYFLISNFLLEYINQDLLRSGYLDVLGARAFTLFFLLGAFNIAFFFGVGFRLIVSIIVLYTANATVEQLITLFNSFSLYDVPILSAHTLSRPLFILGLLAVMFSYRDT